MRPGTRILVVEDDGDIARLVELAWEQCGFEVRCADDGPSGLMAAEAFDPAVVILDIMLPKIDGVGVLKRLRGSGGFTADASHELSTSLTSVSGYAQLLEEGSLKDPQVVRESAAAIR
jgi:CheY-like chemotaxis protein